MRSNFDIEKTIQKMTVEEKAEMCSGKDFWHTKDIERLGIPSVMMCDGPNGLRKQKGQGDHLGIHESIETVCYPTASAMAASFDVELLKELGEVLGEECQAEHVAMLLGPGINMKRSPLCGRNFEYFSEDPYLAGKLAAAYISGLQGKGISACVKHFAANNQETRRMTGTSDMEERTLREIYLRAFEIAVKEGKAQSIMCAYNAVNGVFCSENRKLFQDILREEWGFNGLTVTDWGASKDRIKGIESGIDLEMPGDARENTKQIVLAVERGELSMEDLDMAVRNILHFVKTALQNQKDNVIFDKEKAQMKSSRFSKECAVLLKNTGVLPLDNKKKAAFIGAFAENPRYQGAGSSHINVKHAISAVECMPEITYVKGFKTEDDQVNDEMMEEAKQAAENADYAVIFAGLPENMETEGCDRTHMRLPENQNRLIQMISEVQKNTVVVLHCGAPVELPWADKTAAILCMYLGGDHVGEAAVELLYGKVAPSGKLAETWPQKVEDNPSYLNFPGENGTVKYKEEIFMGYRYYDKKKVEVRFPFGHGLSYTQFEYSGLELDKEKMTDGEVLTVTCKVKNIGEMFGKEVVQLYVCDRQSSVARPVRELKGFEKISLLPGEEKQVKFILDESAFSYYEERINDWFIENGAFEIQIGSSSRDIRLTGVVQWEGIRELPVHYTVQSTIGELLKTKKGRGIAETLLNGRRKAQQENKEGGEEALGEGSRKMMENMMLEMPLNSLVNYGIMSWDQLSDMVEKLNG